MLAIIVYHLLVAGVFYGFYMFVVDRTGDRFTGTEGRAAAVERLENCKNIQELQKAVLGRFRECP